MTVRRRITASLVVVALTLGAPAAAADDLEQDLDQVEAQIEALLHDIDDANAERTGIVSQITATQSVIDDLLADLAVAEQAVADATWQLNLQEIELDKARKAVVDAQLDLATASGAVADGRIAARQAVRALYMGSGRDTPSVVLTSESLDTATVSVAYLARVSAHAGAALVDLEALEARADELTVATAARERELDRQTELLGVIARQREDHAAEVADQAAAVAAKLAEQRALLSEVDTEIAHFEGELDGLEEEQAEIEALIVAEASKGSGGATTTGAYVRPVPGAITSSFGPRLHPILGYIRMHSGVDMTAPYGQEIRALAAGRVILASSNGGYGNTVIVDHGDGLTTLYAHQSSFNVSYGARVQAGDVVGYAGSSGLATGSHLHFEVRINGAAVDPAPYLSGT